MALFRKVHNERFEIILAQFEQIMAKAYQREEMISAVDDFVLLCDTMPASEKKDLQKMIVKQSKRDSSIGAYTHPIIGFFFTKDDLITTLKEKVNRKKWAAIEEIAREHEFANIPEVSIKTNETYPLKSNRIADLPSIRTQKITKSFDIDANLPTFVVIALQSTGSIPSRDAIIEISAMRYEYGEPTEVFITLVNPNVHIPTHISEASMIYDDDVKVAPSINAITESLIEFVGKSPVIGYNILKDLQFLFCAGIDLITKRKIYDVRSFAETLYEDDLGDFSIENVLANFGIGIKELYASNVRCYATGLVFLRMLEDLEDPDYY